MTDVAAALRALKAGEIDAVVYDAPILEFLINRDHDDLIVLPDRPVKQAYAFAFPNKREDLLERVNRELLEFQDSTDYRQLLIRYFGSPRV